MNTPKIKWLNPNRVLGKALTSSLKPVDMLKDFVKFGLLEEISGDYSADTYMMCRNGATWLGAKLMHIGFDDVHVVEGAFLGDPHCWVVIDDTYFDMTIAQSDASYPQFAIVQKEKALGYEEIERVPIMEWAERATA